MNKHFSARYDYRPTSKPITVRKDAPDTLRNAIVLLAQKANMPPYELREVVCNVLLVRPDTENYWSDGPILHEVECLLENAHWYKIYEVAEAIYVALQNGDSQITYSLDPAEFECRLNEFLVENGIGWELQEGKFIHRGADVFTRSTQEVPRILEENGFQNAANEIREALQDISRIPQPDITGSLQHVMAALEATAREVTGKPKPTLGSLISELNLPSPLDKATHKLWGYASNQARHGSEQRTIDRTEAELVVTVAGALCAFISQREFSVNTTET